MKKLLYIVFLIVIIALFSGCSASEPVYITSDDVLQISSDDTLQVHTDDERDTINGPLVVILSEHHEVHVGQSFSVADTVGANTTTVKWQIATANTTTYAHMIFELTATGEATFLVTEGSDRDKGTILNAINRRRVGTPAVSGMEISRAPTGGTTDGATILFSMRNGITGVAGKSIEVGEARANNEWILKPATKYVISITTYANDIYATCLLDWYEHEE